MFSAIRLFAIVLCLAGCTPAAFVQRARPPQACEVQVCFNLGASGRCECTTHDQLIRRTRHGFWPYVE